jgi:hypothetical protein
LLGNKIPVPVPTFNEVVLVLVATLSGTFGQIRASICFCGKLLSAPSSVIAISNCKFLATEPDNDPETSP